jgi:hypothetical protein
MRHDLRTTGEDDGHPWEDDDHRQRVDPARSNDRSAPQRWVRRRKARYRRTSGRGFPVRLPSQEEGTMPRSASVASRLPWWAWIIAGDAVLAAFIMLGPHLPKERVLMTVLSWFALQNEMNLAVWWSAAQLMLGSLLMYERASVRRSDERWAWAILAVISTAWPWTRLARFTSDSGAGAGGRSSSWLSPWGSPSCGPWFVSPGSPATAGMPDSSSSPTDCSEWWRVWSTSSPWSGGGPRAGGMTYDQTWQAALSVDPPWVLVSTWNEWHAGSEIEPSVEHGHRYLEATRVWAERFRRGGS